MSEENKNELENKITDDVEAKIGTVVKKEVNKIYEPLANEKTPKAEVNVGSNYASNKKGEKFNLFAVQVAIAIIVTIVAIVVCVVFRMMDTDKTDDKVADREMRYEYTAASIINDLSDEMFQKAYEAGKLPMIVATYARLEDKSVEEFLETYGITDTSVNGDTPIADAEKFIPLNIYFGSEELFQAMKQEYGLDESVTGQTLYGEVADVIQAKMEEMALSTPE